MRYCRKKNQDWLRRRAVRTIRKFASILTIILLYYYSNAFDNYRKRFDYRSLYYFIVYDNIPNIV